MQLHTVFENTFYKVKNLDIKKNNHKTLEVNRGARIRPTSEEKKKDGKILLPKILKFYP